MGIYKKVKSGHNSSVWKHCKHIQLQGKVAKSWSQNSSECQAKVWVCGVCAGRSGQFPQSTPDGPHLLLLGLSELGSLLIKPEELPRQLPASCGTSGRPHVPSQPVAASLPLETPASQPPGENLCSGSCQVLCRLVGSDGRRVGSFIKIPRVSPRRIYMDFLGPNKCMCI